MTPAAAQPASAAPSEQADVALVTCLPTSTYDVSYNPPLRLRPVDTVRTTERSYTGCVSTVPGLTGGSGTDSQPRTLSCVDLLASGSSVYTITWNTGQTSTLDVENAINIVGGTITVTQTGTVASGLFAGATVTQQIVGVSLALIPCTLGLGSFSGFTGTTTLLIV
ncbi:hypothetical protein [Promicromonospora iranensis]|uniref:Ig-like domain-containing protein n=1 Tax=Promicromonospora iranensis TaxID=1105144 RepID=A0ABU2CIR4_9MICO|nr:hypothetical protein [Promicromonospora iranensis]MDR7381202.1 hypothetical protein [Promicromonospora iranensis]